MTHIGVAPALIELMGYEQRGSSWGWGEQAMANTHTHSVPRDTHDGWRLWQGSDAILTHERVVRPLTKLTGYVHHESAV